MNANTLIELHDVGKSFRAADGTARHVLEHVDFILHEGEIVALLGKSGSGKSTLLRIMAGLVNADQGTVMYRGQPVYGPAAGISMVFQSFALFPWLTAQQNVELGLEAQGVAPAERARRADEVLDLIGLGGFGGRCRASCPAACASAWASPGAGDEPGRAADGRGLLGAGRADRRDAARRYAGTLGRKPHLDQGHPDRFAQYRGSGHDGRPHHRVRQRSGPHPQPGADRLPRPRNPDSAEVRALIDEVYALMTSRPAHGAPTPRQQGLGYRFPQTEVERMEGVLDVLAEAPFNGRADLPKLAEEAEISDDDLLPACEALGLFGLAQIDRGDIFLTPLGQRYVLADQGQKQLIFGRQLLAHVPLAAHIRHSLEQEPTGQLPEKNFLDSLEEFLKPDEAERVLKIAVEWGRYGEIYGYDYRTGVLTLPEQEPAA